MNTGHTVSRYPIHQLYSHGVRHIFPVPGDYALGFSRELERSRLQVIDTCDEQGRILRPTPAPESAVRERFVIPIASEA